MEGSIPSPKIAAIFLMEPVTLVEAIFIVTSFNLVLISESTWPSFETASSNTFIVGWTILVATSVSVTAHSQTLFLKWLADDIEKATWPCCCLARPKGVSSPRGINTVHVATFDLVDASLAIAVFGVYRHIRLESGTPSRFRGIDMVTRDVFS